MPRKRIPLVSDCPYHVCSRSHNKDWFRLDMRTVWAIAEDYLYLIVQLYGLRIHAFVLMSNHYHLLVSAPNSNLSDALLYFQRETSKEIARLSGRINQTWGNRNYKTMIGQYHYYMNTYKYVYRNPVRAGLCARVEEYPYSTLHGICGQSPLYIPVVEDTLLFTPSFDEDELRWLNRPSRPELEVEVGRALKRPSFELRRQRNTRKPSQLETQRL